MLLLAAGEADAAGPLQLLAAPEVLPVLGIRSSLLGARGHADTRLQTPLSLRQTRLREHTQGSHFALASHAGLRSISR